LSAFHATNSELTGQPTPSQTTALTTTSEVLALETVVAPVIGIETTETIPSSIASTEPPQTGTLQAPATETDTRVGTTQLHTTSEAGDTTQIASPLASQSQGQTGFAAQPDLSLDDGDAAQFIVSHRLNSSATPSIDP
jgi:hypothetical protein